MCSMTTCDFFWFHILVHKQSSIPFFWNKWNRWAMILWGTVHLLASSFRSHSEETLFKSLKRKLLILSSSIFVLTKWCIWEYTHPHSTDLLLDICISFYIHLYRYIYVYIYVHIGTWSHKETNRNTHTHTHRKLCRQVVWVEGKQPPCSNSVNNTETEAGHTTGSGEADCRTEWTSSRLHPHTHTYIGTHWQTYTHISQGFVCVPGEKAFLTGLAATATKQLELRTGRWRKSASSWFPRQKANLTFSLDFEVLLSNLCSKQKFKTLVHFIPQVNLRWIPWLWFLKLI